MLSLQDFLKESGCDENLAKLMGEVIPIAVKQIRHAIADDVREITDVRNASGDTQLALDIVANEIVKEELEESGMVSWMASEEMENSVMVSPSNHDMGFSVVFDPLDGSSLADVNFAVGTIFGVYPEGSPIGKTGDDQVAAAYAVYGPHTTYVLTVKKGTHEFRLAEDGNFYLTQENLQIAPEAKYFAPGNLRAAAEREDYLKLVNEWIKRGLTLRYSGGMVPDLNHILLKGSGVFSYPGYSKAPEGKLRLLFECAPMALIAEQAGGAASDGMQRILEKKIMELHQRSPIYIGSEKAIEECVAALTK